MNIHNSRQRRNLKLQKLYSDKMFIQEMEIAKQKCYKQIETRLLPLHA
jgi:hypothetical protein